MIPPPALRGVLAALLLLVLLPAAPAWAQLDSREAIALQNQILELRRELDQLRRGGAVAPPSPRGGSGGGLSTEAMSRLQELEEEVRRQRGRADVAENQNRQLREDIEKLLGDMDFRLRALEGTGARPPPGGRGQPPAPPIGAGPQPPAQPQFQAPAPPPQQPPPAASVLPRTPERVLAEGQAALARRDFATAEASAREVLANRGNNPRAYDARFLLADALAGRGNHQSAAVEYGEAYRLNTRGSRSAEALIGFGGALANMDQRREACEALDLAQSENPNLRGALRDRLSAARSRARCR